MKKWLLVLAMLIAGLQYWQQREQLPPADAAHSGSTVDVERNAPSAEDEGASTRALSLAFNERRSGVRVRSEGVVTRVLADDNDGSRHQRFLLRLESGHSLLISHNIDLAPRVDGLHQGDSVAFAGEYEWNERGGVVHWTHRDPAGKHVAGWLRHDGKLYQ